MMSQSLMPHRVSRNLSKRRGSNLKPVLWSLSKKIMVLMLWMRKTMLTMMMTMRRRTVVMIARKDLTRMRIRSENWSYDI